jgi:glycosyltransferase involved in cell wall biosynthesis
MKVAFITNICPHYRVKTFETLARYHDVDFYFFSSGDEWYWQKQHNTYLGDFHAEYLGGFQVGGTRITPALPFKIWRGKYDVIVKCITGRFALPVTYLTARLLGKPFVLWTGIWMRLQTPVQRLIFPLTRYIYHHADAIVVYGEHVKRYLISEGSAPEKIFTTTHAVDNQVYGQDVPVEQQESFRQSLKIQPDEKVVLYLGRLEESKGLPYLFQAFAELKDTAAVLVVAGDGSLRCHLEQIARDLGILEQIRFVGYLPTKQALLYYAIAWVFVLPSITMPQGKEPWGLVVNEAFNQGVPAIVTETVGAAAGGLVQKDVNGFIVRERDSTALTEALQQVLDDPDLRHRLGQNARQAMTHWDNENMVLGFRQAIESATDDGI